MFHIYFFSALTESLLKVKPDFIVYNAGTDILKGDQLGLLSVTPEASFLKFNSYYKGKAYSFISFITSAIKNTDYTLIKIKAKQSYSTNIL